MRTTAQQGWTREERKGTKLRKLVSFRPSRITVWFIRVLSCADYPTERGNGASGSRFSRERMGVESEFDFWVCLRILILGTPMWPSMHANCRTRRYRAYRVPVPGSTSTGVATVPQACSLRRAGALSTTRDHPLRQKIAIAKTRSVLATGPPSPARPANHRPPSKRSRENPGSPSSTGYSFIIVPVARWLVITPAARITGSLSSCWRCNLGSARWNAPPPLLPGHEPSDVLAARKLLLADVED